MIVKTFKSLENSNDFVVFRPDNTISKVPLTQCTSQIISMYMKYVEKKWSASHDEPMTPPNIETSTTSDPETGDNYIIFTLTYPDPDVEDLTIDDYKSLMSSSS